MKKLIEWILCALTFTMVFTSCGISNDRNKLVIYTPHAGDPDRAKFILSAAKEELGLDIEFVSGGGGALKDRLVLEKDNPQADVVVALYQLFMFELKNENVLAAYKPTWADDIDSFYVDNENYFHGFGKTPIIVAYNSDFVSSENAPDSWLELGTEKFKGKYSIGSLENQTTRLMLTAILWRYFDDRNQSVSEEGWDYISSLYENAKITQNAQFNWADVKDGSLPIITDWYGGARGGAENYDINLTYIDFEDGTPIAAESIALINNCKNLENAKKFIDWFGSTEFMVKYANEYFTSMGQMPLSQKAIDLCDDNVKSAANYFKQQEVDWSVASKYSPDWITKIQLEIAK